MTEREGKEDDRGGTAEVRFILFIFTVSLFVVVLRGFSRFCVLFPKLLRLNIVVCPRVVRCFLCIYDKV